MSVHFAGGRFNNIWRKPHHVFALYWALLRSPQKLYIWRIPSDLSANPPRRSGSLCFFTIRHNRFHSQCVCNIVFMAISKCCSTHGERNLNAIYFYKALIADGIVGFLILMFRYIRPFRARPLRKMKK